MTERGQELIHHWYDHRFVVETPQYPVAGALEAVTAPIAPHTVSGEAHLTLDTEFVPVSAVRDFVRIYALTLVSLVSTSAKVATLSA